MEEKPQAISLSVHILKSAQKSGYFHPPLILALFLTCESSQFDTAGHVVIEEDPSSFVVAFDDGVQSLRTDTVA